MRKIKGLFCLNNQHKILISFFLSIVSLSVSFGQNIGEQICFAYNKLEKQTYIQNLVESYEQMRIDSYRHRIYQNCNNVASSNDSVSVPKELSYVRNNIEHFKQAVYYAEKNGVFVLNICIADSANVSIDTSSLSFNILCIKNNGDFVMGFWCKDGRYYSHSERFMYMDFRRRVNKEIKRGLKKIIKLSPQYVLWSYDLNDNILFLKDDILYVYRFFAKKRKIYTITDYLQQFGIRTP